VRTCELAHSGSCAAQIGRTRTGTATLDDFPNSVTGTPGGAAYRASVWVRAPSLRTITLRIREYSGSTVLRSTTTNATGNGGWQQLAATSAATSAGHSVSVDVSVSLTSGMQAQIDDVSLRLL
jgi:hypothetical protein